VNIEKRRRALEQAEDELRDANSEADRKAAKRKVKTARKDLHDAEDQLADSRR
jgi:hypothetical protein